MSDITKCSNEECIIKEQCRRYTAPPHPYYQYVHNYQPDKDGKCIWFLKDKKNER